MFNFLLNIYYRIFAPNNPRGWVTIYKEKLPPASNTLRVFTEGMQKFDLYNLEVIAVPEKLSGMVHGVMFDLMDYLKNKKVIKNDETFGIKRGDQVVMEGKFQTSQNKDTAGRNLMRIIDVNSDYGLPGKLLHEKVVAESFASNYSPAKQAELLELALECYDGDPKKPITTLEEANESLSKNAAVAFQAIADAYADLGMKEKAIEALEKFCSRSPYDAKEYQKIIVEELDKGNLPPEDVRSKFWRQKSWE